MKKLWYLILVLLVLAAGTAFGHGRQDIERHKYCQYCGMDRAMFDATRMLVTYDDGSEVAVCSLHCAAVDIANNIDRTPIAIRVGDGTTRELIDAETAYWVIGGKHAGVMSKRGKWAFLKKDDAEDYVKSNGGTPANFESAMKAAFEDMYADTKMIREKRRMNRMKQSSGNDRT